ncbi:hypothetical protein MFIFM68171_05825 [Madurella fahalii]|uniref:Uncharacterized protein n=1 Tax=Madurella fahalii TaxID=1157608 RepID=A0ABQ0GDJ3_9PEZI
MIRLDGSRTALITIVLFFQGHGHWVLIIRYGATICGILALMFVPIIFSTDYSALDLQELAAGCRVEIDANIADDGIRITVWAQEMVLILIAILGAFHSSTTRAKEIGAGIAITHVALTVALLIQMTRGTLTSADAIMGSMLLDSQSSALSLQLLTKETLAARWQVYIMAPCQALGLGLLPLPRFQTGSLLYHVKMHYYVSA